MRGIYPHGKGFQAKVMLKGTRYVETFTTTQAAEAWIYESKAAHKLGRPIPNAKAGSTRTSKLGTIRALAEHTDKEFWTGNPDCRSSETLSRNAFLFAEWCGPNMPVAEALERDRIMTYLNHRDDKLGNAGGTVNRHRSSILKMAGEAARLGMITGKPLVRKWPEGEPRQRVYSRAEESTIFAALKLWGYDDLHDLLLFLSETGCRLGETERMPWGAFQESLLMIPATVPHLRTAKPIKLTKSGKARMIGLSRLAREAVARLQAKHSSLTGPFIWHKRFGETRSVWARLRRHFTWMDEQCVIHTFRHTFASRMAEEEGHLTGVQKWLGHANPTTTQRYIKYTPQNIAGITKRQEQKRERDLGVSA